jgi:hypothetical protein
MLFWFCLILTAKMSLDGSLVSVHMVLHFVLHTTDSRLARPCLGSHLLNNPYSRSFPCFNITHVSKVDHLLMYPYSCPISRCR